MAEAEDSVTTATPAETVNSRSVKSAKVSKSAKSKRTPRAAMVEPESESREHVDVILSKNHKGSRRVVVMGNIFDLNVTDKDSPDYNFAQMKLTPSEQEQLKKRGFLIKKSAKVASEDQKTRKRTLRSERAQKAQ